MMVEAVPPQTYCVFNDFPFFCHKLHEKPWPGELAPLLLGPRGSLFSGSKSSKTHRKVDISSSKRTPLHGFSFVNPSNSKEFCFFFVEVANSPSFSPFSLMEIKKVYKTHLQKSQETIEHSWKSILDVSKHTVFSMIPSENDELCAWNDTRASLMDPHEILWKWLET